MIAQQSQIPGVALRARLGENPVAQPDIPRPLHDDVVVGEAEPLVGRTVAGRRDAVLEKVELERTDFGGDTLPLEHALKDAELDRRVLQPVPGHRDELYADGSHDAGRPERRRATFLVVPRHDWPHGNVGRGEGPLCASLDVGRLRLDGEIAQRLLLEFEVLLRRLLGSLSRHSHLRADPGARHCSMAALSSWR